MDITGVIQEILEGDVDYNSILSSGLLSKLGSSANGICEAFTNIQSELFTANGVWTSPPNEICWAIALATAGSGGGGGSGPFSLAGFNPTAGDAGSPGGDGGDAVFDTTIIATGGSGGAGGVYLNNPHESTLPNCESNQYNLGSFSSFGPIAGSGSYYTRKSNEYHGITDPYWRYGGTGQFGGNGYVGEGGYTGKFGVQVLKDLSPSTGYPIIVGAGGAAGADHPTFTQQIASNAGRTARAATAGTSGQMLIIYSGY